MVWQLSKCATMSITGASEQDAIVRAGALLGSAALIK